MSSFFPVYLSLFNEQCLVVGGGKVAERKIKNILPASPIITVVSPRITSVIQRLANQKRIVWHDRNFTDSDLDGKVLVFAATDNQLLNKEIAILCKKRRILVNVAKPGKEGSFIVPSFISKGEMSFAFSTQGEAPFFSALVKRDMQKRHQLYCKLLKILKPFRSHLLTKKDDKGYNKLILDTFFNNKIFELLEKGDMEKVKNIAEKFFLATKKD